MWMTRVSINNPVFATMVMIGLTVLGVFAYNRLKVEQLPDVSIPVIWVSVPYPGASPEQVENDVLKPIETAVNTVAGVKKIRAVAYEGRGNTSIEFNLNADMSKAMQDVRDKIQQARAGFPKDVKEPFIGRGETENSEPVATLTLIGGKDRRELTTLTKQTVVKALERLPGVGQVVYSGDAERQVRIELKPRQLQAYSIGVDQAVAAIRAANQDLPVGNISSSTAEAIVRIEGKMKSPEAFGRIIVANRNGAPIYLSQVADIIDGEREESSIARMNGQTAISIEVYRQQDANLVEVGKAVREALKDLKKLLPPNVELKMVWSPAEWVEGSLDRVKSTILEGAFLTVLIVFLFLHSWRSTIITGLTLPIAVIATFIALSVFGFTLNFLTLMALSLCIGLLIDDAIVVRENIVRHLAMGKDHKTAALEATEEIGLAVMATTFAIVAVFVPIAFMSGIIGRFFFQFGITVTVAVLVSLFVSFTLDPMLSSVWYDPPQNRFKRMPWLHKVMDGFEAMVDAAHRIYDRLLRWSLVHRIKVLLLAFVSFVGSFFVLPFVGTEFVPEVDQGWISLRLNTPVGSSLAYTDQKARQVENFLSGLKEIEFMATTVGTDEGKNYARINLNLVDREKAPRRSQKELEKVIRDELSKIAGIELSLGWGKPIYVAVLGPDANQLNKLAQAFAEKVKKIRGTVDVETSMKTGTPALAVRLNNELAAEMGITVSQVGAALRPLIGGDTVSYWLGPDGQNYDVVVQTAKNNRRLASDLADLTLTSSKTRPDGTPLLVPLRQIADLVETENPQSIRRQDLQRRVAIMANVEGRPSGDVGSEVQKLIKETQASLPPGYRFDLGGQTKDMQDAFLAAMAALGLAVIFIYLILASQFGSFLQPLAIMASLPLSLIGVFLALVLTKTTLNIFSIIGFIMLMGLVTKNAILLVDFANREQKAGLDRFAALLSAGQIRLRPILMTTAAMVFGMLPLALGVGEGAEQQAPMGRAIIGGVITSTLLTLVVVPVIYSYLDAIGAWFAKRHAAKQEAMRLLAEGRTADSPAGAE